jgi:hypothetical protein
MKLFSLAVVSLVGLAAGAPAAVPAEVEKRQGCSVGFVFARGSTEPSPLVSFALGALYLTAHQPFL